MKGGVDFRLSFLCLLINLELAVLSSVPKFLGIFFFLNIFLFLFYLLFINSLFF